MQTITCDQCGADLSTPTPRPDYYLTLQMRDSPTTDAVFAVYCAPPLPAREMHFCGKRCLVEKMDSLIK